MPIKPFSRLNRILDFYISTAYLIVLALFSKNLQTIRYPDWQTGLYAGIVFLTYGLIYLLPVIVLLKLGFFVWRRVTGGVEPPDWSVWAFFGLVIGLNVIIDLIIYSDSLLYRHFGFHLNGFVWNLVTTPGGVESMGAGSASWLSVAAITIFLIVLHAAVLVFSFRFIRNSGWTAALRFRRFFHVLIALFVAATLCERVAYGISHLQSRNSILAASEAFFLYQPTTFRSVAESLGMNVSRTDRQPVRIDDGMRLRYPLRSITVNPPRKLFNIVWLVAESWRFDMLDPDIMPATWKFSCQAHRFRQHYSGGNGTRMGLFSMFYGLYGNYWFSFLDEERSPVLIDVLQNQGYQTGFFTSAKFSYPEFDKTILATVPKDALHEYNDGEGWQRDRKNVGNLLSFIRNRETGKPFMAFMFFESPHARYYFPEECVIRRPYLPEVNYADLSLKADAPLIKNRYINSCRHLDSQFKRVFDYLEEEGLLEDTIVIVTGDHGEEFMEKGRWGHNSEFTEEQVRVPLVLWIPGAGNSVVNRMTSHLDIAPTLLPMLGVTNPPEDYSSGSDMLGDSDRTYSVIADWSTLGYVDAEYKARIPVTAGGFLSRKVSRKDDSPVNDPDVFYKSRKDALAHIVLETGRFYRKMS